MQPKEAGMSEAEISMVKGGCLVCLGGWSVGFLVIFVSKRESYLYTLEHTLIRCLLAFQAHF